MSQLTVATEIFLLQLPFLPELLLRCLSFSQQSSGAFDGPLHLSVWWRRKTQRGRGGEPVRLSASSSERQKWGDKDVPVSPVENGSYVCACRALPSLRPVAGLSCPLERPTAALPNLVSPESNPREWTHAVLHPWERDTWSCGTSVESKMVDCHVTHRASSGQQAQSTVVRWDSTSPCHLWIIFHPSFNCLALLRSSCIML